MGSNIANPMRDYNDKLLPPYLHEIENKNIVFPQTGKINVWDIALQQHYRRNAHHPEHYTNPSEMDDLNKRHMLCDLLGSYLGGQWKWSTLYPKWTIPQLANVCKKWKNWKFVQDVYTGPFDENDIRPYSRWIPNSYCAERSTFVLWFQLFLAGKINIEVFIEGLYNFKSIEYYIKDLQWHKYAVFHIGQKLFPNDKLLIENLITHDDDKWDAFMIAAYVLKWIFNEEIVEIEEDFQTIDFDCFVYYMKQKGKYLKTIYENKMKNTCEKSKLLKVDESPINSSSKSG